MPSLGSFGRRYDRLDADFEYFGDTIRVNPSCSKAALIEFLAEADGISQDDEVRGAQLIMRTMREVVHPDDFDRFWTIAKQERQDPHTDILPIAQAVIEASTGFPTGRPSASGSGRATAPPRFEVDLPSGDVPRLSPEAIRSMQHLDGRPDLQLTVLQAQEGMSRVSL